MKFVLVTEGSEPLLDLVVGTCGVPALPRAGEYLAVNGQHYLITSVLWHYDEQTVYVAGKVHT